MQMLGSVVSLVALVATSASPRPSPRARAMDAPPRAAHGAPSTVVITATDYAFTGMPATVAAGWVTIRMVNRGHELHMFATANVPHGYTVASVTDSMLHDGHLPDDMREWGGPNAVAPGDTGTVTMYLPAGEYVVGCFVESPDGKTHFVKGMMSSFRVAQTSSRAGAPSSAHVVTLSTYAIAMTGPAIRPGIDTLRVHNTAKERHDLVVLRVEPGHSVADALAWFTRAPAGKGIATPVAGTTGLHTGEDAFVSGHFTPGTYVLVCWMSTNGKMHFQLGMKHVFTVAS